MAALVTTIRKPGAQRQSQDIGGEVEELGIVLVKRILLPAVRFENTPAATGGADDHVDGALHAVDLQHIGAEEALLNEQVVAHNGYFRLERVARGGVRGGREADHADDAGIPADTRAEQQVVAFLLVPEDLRVLHPQAGRDDFSGQMQH